MSGSLKKKKTLHERQIDALYQLLNTLEAQEAEGSYSGKIHPVWFWRTVFETLYYTGIRRNQLLHIRLQDVNLYSQTLFIGLKGSKSHKEYEVPICQALLPSLTALCDLATRMGFKADDQLFNVTRFGTQRPFRHTTMQDHSISNCYRELSERLGFKVSPHRFRHTLGTQLMKSPEKNMHLVKEILGHSDIRTTLEYIEPDLDQLRNLLEVIPNLKK